MITEDDRKRLAEALDPLRDFGVLEGTDAERLAALEADVANLKAAVIAIGEVLPGLG